MTKKARSRSRRNAAKRPPEAYVQDDAPHDELSIISHKSDERPSGFSFFRFTFWLACFILNIWTPSGMDVEYRKEHHAVADQRPFFVTTYAK